MFCTEGCSTLAVHLQSYHCLQDLEVQNNELVEANEKLQKEMVALRSLAKEAILEKKKSQAALETLKHQVVQLLAERNMLPKQIPKQEEQDLNPAPPASTGKSLLGFASHNFDPDLNPAPLVWQSQYAA